MIDDLPDNGDMELLSPLEHLRRGTVPFFESFGMLNIQDYVRWLDTAVQRQRWDENTLHGQYGMRSSNRILRDQTTCNVEPSLDLALVTLQVLKQAGAYRLNLVLDDVDCAIKNDDFVCPKIGINFTRGKNRLFLNFSDAANGKIMGGLGHYPSGLPFQLEGVSSLEFDANRYFTEENRPAEFFLRVYRFDHGNAERDATLRRLIEKYDDVFSVDKILQKNKNTSFVRKPLILEWNGDTRI